MTAGTHTKNQQHNNPTKLNTKDQMANGSLRPLDAGPADGMSCPMGIQFWLPVGAIMVEAPSFPDTTIARNSSRDTGPLG